MNNHTQQAGETATRSIAVFTGGDGDCWTLEVSPGCEIFIGRFARLAEMRAEDGVIRFRALASATRP